MGITDTLTERTLRARIEELEVERDRLREFTKNAEGFADACLFNLAGNGLDTPVTNALVVPALRMLRDEARTFLTQEEEE